MQKRTISFVLATISVVFLCIVIALSPVKAPDQKQINDTTVTVRNALALNSPTEHVQKDHSVLKAEDNEVLNTDDEQPVDEQLIIENFISMLNKNECYGAAFDSQKTLIMGSAVSLLDCASDIPGFGFCINNTLLVEFMKSFYGIDISFEALNGSDAPEGYIAVPIIDLGSHHHTPILLEKIDRGYKLLTEVSMYFGGDDQETMLAVSEFLEDNNSPYGFILSRCELL